MPTPQVVTLNNKDQYLPQTNFHPSFFEVGLQTQQPQSLMLTGETGTAGFGNDRNLQDLEREINYKGNPLENTDLTTLISPGSYSLNPQSESVINTGYIMKNYQETPLSKIFFSNKNIQNLQNLIRLLVFKHTSHHIDSQHETELIVIMRSMYLDHHKIPTVWYPQYITTEVGRLNELVLNEIVPKVVSQLMQYIGYLKDASTPPGSQSFGYGQATSIRGQKEYRSPTQVWFGGDF